MSCGESAELFLHASTRDVRDGVGETRLYSSLCDPSAAVRLEQAMLLAIDGDCRFLERLFLRTSRQGGPDVIYRIDALQNLELLICATSNLSLALAGTGHLRRSYTASDSCGWSYPFNCSQLPVPSHAFLIIPLKRLKK